MTDHTQNDDGIGDESQTEKDTSYSPSSGRDTKRLQHESADRQAERDDVNDGDDVQVLPGTGGPDDAGATSAGDDIDPEVDLGR
ncbi:hypothetical protein OSC27_14325 [Microbacterium sp. STN6]|uniref:hypothetical protein n=1 Tax=Microbacterium sp. STN6 TaxID=2995588 RepID=UPI002260CD8D|nr:hypothetical protein [Microbacterium sp. STN6]MCX7523448.1 hypothetical protein [Microbacterium sp. STN6]